MCVLAAPVAAVAVFAAFARASSTEPDPVPYALVRGMTDDSTRFRGVVADPFGRPAAGARVAVQTGLSNIDALTDADGRFDVALPVASPVARCIVSTPGSAVAVGRWLDVVTGHATDAGRIAMRPSARVEGQVLDAAGAPVPWAWLEIDGTSVFGADWKDIARLVGVRFMDCDPVTGRFVIDTLPEGTWGLVGHAIGHDVEGVTVAAPKAGVRLGATPYVDGPRLDVDAFLSPSDSALPDDEIVATTESGSVHGKRVAVSMMEEFLRFPVSLPCTLVYAGNVWHDRVEVPLDRVPHDPIRIALRPRHPSALGGVTTISGTVELNGAALTWNDGADGVGASGYRCTVEAQRCESPRRDDGPPRSATTTTRPDGSFTFEGLQRGSYVLRAQVETCFGDPVEAPLGPEYMVSAGKGPVRVAMRARLNPELKIDIPGAIRQAPDFRVDAAAARNSTNFPCVVSGDRVTVRGVPPGRFDVSVRVRANGVWSRRVVVSGDTTRPLPTAVIPHGRRIKGRVLADGRPVPGAVVMMRPSEDCAAGGDVVVTDTNGRFELDGFDRSVSWSLNATAPAGYGYAPLSPSEAAAEIFLFAWPSRDR